MKEATSCSVIGGADGPTSIFLVGGGRDKNIFRRTKNDFRNWRYQNKRKRAEKSIVPGAHSLTETVYYIQNKYGAIEMDITSDSYLERKNQMKYSLLQRERPDLVGGELKILPPENLEDTNSVQEWLKKMEEWIKHGEELTASLPEEVFSIDYHVYIIDTNSHIEIEIENERGILGVSASGNQKEFKAVIKDIYLYYGVTMKDIEEKTERYQNLVGELTM